MIVKYSDAVSYINDKEKFGSRLGLDSIGKLLEFLGNPQDRLKIIHIAGTNGKGSTSSYISNCLIEAGYNVGLFTSPFLERFNERIQINGKDIPDEDLGLITSLIKKAADKMVEEGLEHPTTFEIVTAIAFAYYAERSPDYVVLEVGLGGRFDSTNIIKTSLASVITTIDFDHIKELGDTLGKIAYQKAGIIKEDGIVISYPQEDEATEVIKAVAKEKNAQVYISPDIEIIQETNRGSIFNYGYGEDELRDIKIGMIGHYQNFNAALAITTLLVLRNKGKVQISNNDIYSGLEKTRWKGRLEVIREKPTFLIDGAHNMQGIKNLAKALKLFNYKRLILGIAILKDKDVDHMVEELAGMANEIVVTEANIPRKMEAEELGEKISKYNKKIHIEKDIEEAVKKALDLAESDDLIVFGGSLYLIGDVRGIAKRL